jgi:hypothetical protein
VCGTWFLALTGEKHLKNWILRRKFGSDRQHIKLYNEEIINFPSSFIYQGYDSKVKEQDELWKGNKHDEKCTGVQEWLGVLWRG